jgi:hypothetical protein
MHNISQNHISLATYPARQSGFRQMWASIYNNVDNFYVWLNEYATVPDFLKGLPNVTAYIAPTDMKDTGKFMPLNLADINGYFITVDDDFIYPPTYIADMVAAVEKYNRKAIVTHHGYYYTAPIGDNFYYSKCKRVRTNYPQQSDMLLHIGGTGVMAFHTDTLKFDVTEHFPVKRMSDIWLSLLAAIRDIPIYGLAHAGDYLRPIIGTFEKGIFSELKRAPDYQTHIVKKVYNILTNNTMPKTNFTRIQVREVRTGRELSLLNNGHTRQAIAQGLYTVVPDAVPVPMPAPVVTDAPTPTVPTQVEPEPIAPPAVMKSTSADQPTAPKPKAKKSKK